jgi:MFS family permease
MNKAPEIVPLREGRPGLFYGYIIAILAFCIILVVYGLRFSYGVFFKPMSSELGWTNATTSLIYSVSMLMEGLFNIILGAVMDRYGPRLLITISGILVAAGYCLIPTVNSAWQLFILYGGLVGIGMGGIFAPLVSIIARWFTARRNLITGLVVSSVGIGILIVSPLANKLIDIFDWRVTFLIFGIAIFLITTICAQFLKRDPATMGLVPYGEENKRDKNLRAPAHGLAFSEAVHSYQFWFVFFLFFAYGFSSNSVSIHIVPDAIKFGISAAVAASILASIGGLQIAGRIGLGLAADRAGNRVMFILGFLLFTALTFWLPAIQSTWAFFLFAIIFGFAQGGMASSQSPIVAGLFGVKSLGLLFGCVGFGFTIGAAAGPFVTGKIVDAYGSYQMAFIICSGISLAALIAAIILKPLKNSPSRKIPL